MDTSSYTIGQAVYIRTDTPEYEEEVIPFRNLAEMVEVCSKSHSNMVLEKIIIYSMSNGDPKALTLGFISASNGQRPGTPGNLISLDEK